MSLRDQRPKAILPLRLGAARIGRGVHIQKPPGRWQCFRVRYMSGLYQYFDGKDRHGLAQAGRGGLKR
jgi:hypothetical protein